jgi:hypothetical protein
LGIWKKPEAVPAAHKALMGADRDQGHVLDFIQNGVDIVYVHHHTIPTTFADRAFGCMSSKASMTENMIASA